MTMSLDRHRVEQGVMRIIEKGLGTTEVYLRTVIPKEFPGSSPEKLEEMEFEVARKYNIDLNELRRKYDVSGGSLLAQGVLPEDIIDYIHPI